MGTSLSYRDAGVDTDTGDQLVENVKPFAKRIMRPEVLGDLGGFGALVEIGKKYKNPVSASGTDDVGAKLKLASDWDKHDTVGIDLVTMSVSDILVQGIEPLSLLDYFARGKLDVARVTDVIRGIAQGCEEPGCALTSGETAEMPSMYFEGEYDLAGFTVSVAEKERVINGRSIQAGDVVLDSASNGAHSSGYSLVREITERDNPDLDAEFDYGKTLRETIIASTRLYMKPTLAALEKFIIKGMAHTTGGNIIENVSYVLPENTVAQIDAKTWESPKLSQRLQKAGNAEIQEMCRMFNCGIGVIVVIAKKDADAAQALSSEQGETVYRLDVIRERNGDEYQIQVA